MPKRFLCVLFVLIITGSFLFALEGKIVETIGKVEVQKAGSGFLLRLAMFLRRAV